MSRFLTVVASDEDLLSQLGLQLSGRGQLEPGVRVRAVGAGWAEAGEVVDAQHATHVPEIKGIKKGTSVGIFSRCIHSNVKLIRTCACS